MYHDLGVSFGICLQTRLLVLEKYACISAFVLHVHVCCLFKGGSLVCFIGWATVNTSDAIHAIRCLV